VPRLLGFLFGRLGRRYPRLVLAVQFQFGHLVAMFGLGLLLLYQRMSVEDFVRLTLAAQALGLARARRPPVAYLRRRKLVPIFCNALPWSLYAKYELGLTWISVPILLAGATVVILYGVALRYFAMELSMRPVLQKVSGDLPDDFALGRGGVGMGLKLLVALPMLNIITSSGRGAHEPCEDDRVQRGGLVELLVGLLGVGQHRVGGPDLSDQGVEVGQRGAGVVGPRGGVVVHCEHLSVVSSYVRPRRSQPAVRPG